MVDVKSLPPTASADGEAAALQVQTIETATLDEDTVPQAAEKSVEKEIKAKKASDAGLKNYFVSITVTGLLFQLTFQQRVFKYGTSLDYLLIGLSCLTSIGSGIVSELQANYH